MRSPLPLPIALVFVAGAAQAAGFSPCNPEGRGLLGCTEASRVRLVDYHEAAPVVPVPVPPTSGPVVPSPIVPSVDAKTNFFIIGLGLAAGGLIAGGAGFAVLAACKEGSSCYGQTSQIVGWVLAAPGVIPLVVGLAMMYFTAGAKHVERETSSSPTRWALTASPIRGGGMVGGAVSF